MVPPSPHGHFSSRPPPRLAGLALRIVATLAGHRVFGIPLRRRLLRDVGIERFRELKLEEPPTESPLVPPTEAQRNAKPFSPAELISWVGSECAGRAPGFRSPSVADYFRAYRDGQMDPERVARRVIESIRASEGADPPLHAMIHSRHEDLLRQARASAQRWETGHPLSPLDGVPVAVKDELNQVPYPTHAGTRFLGSSPASVDATAVARLRAAGALLIGKTNMDEIGLGVTGLNAHHGVVRNPHDPGYHTGGSSGGSAAAVAAGICPIAIGADGGGSIRIPAAFCGVVGLKPTYGRISEHGAWPLCQSVAHIGPLAFSARDAALAYAVMAGEDPADKRTRGQPPVQWPDFAKRDLSGFRLGVCETWDQATHPDHLPAYQAALAEFVKRGATLQPVSLPDLDVLQLAHAVLISSEVAAAMAPYDEDHRDDFGLDVRLNLALARQLKRSDSVNAQRVRTHAMEVFAQAFEQVDAIVTPATACPVPAIRPDALPAGESDLDRLQAIMRFAVAGNLAGLPAISFPIGYDSADLPVGMQALAPWWEEARLLELAAISEEFVGRRQPKVWFEQAI
jgi:Asp-tRNA(Asn)/Glu-tRNA(Gln) amidotransferase A subunit family amidase